MATRDPNITKAAISFASKFGFLTQEVFFEFLCARSRTQKYVYWESLIKDRLFVESKRNSKVLYFSKKGMAVAGPLAVKRRYYYYVEHDLIAAKVFLHLQETGSLVRLWTEAELRAAPVEAIGLVGCGDTTKLPDLVVDLNGADGFVRIAFEIEASRKSRERYRQISLSYLAMERINLVVFVCENQALEQEIHRAFSSSIFSQAGKSPVTLLIENFERDRLDAKANFLGRNLPLRELLEKAVKTDLKTLANIPYADRIQIRKDFGKIEKASA